jgi:lipid-binding SYLF domain-containing protein
MSHPRRFLTTILALASLAPGLILAQSRDDERRAEILANAQTTLEKLFATVEGSQALYDTAAGYAVFTATKGGFIVTGGGGSGVCFDKATGDPTFMKMGLGGVGLGIGGQRYSLVILFETAERLQAFIDGGWDSGVAAQATGGSEAAGTGTGFLDGAALYTLDQKGLMASVDVSGTRFWVNEDLEEDDAEDDDPEDDDPAE